MYHCVSSDPVRNILDVQEILWGECLWRIQGEEAREGEESPQTSTALTPVKERQRKNWVKEPLAAGPLWECLGWANGESPKQKLPVRGVPPSSKNSPALVHPLRLVTGWAQPEHWHTSEGATAGGSQATVLLEGGSLEGSMAATAIFPKTLFHFIIYIHYTL